MLYCPAPRTHAQKKVFENSAALRDRGETDLNLVCHLAIRPSFATLA